MSDDQRFATFGGFCDELLPGHGLLHEESRLVDDLAWGLLDVLVLVADIEQRLGVSVPHQLHFLSATLGDVFYYYRLLDARARESGGRPEAVGGQAADCCEG